MTSLPLFPLNTVLFPGTILPLHVFEERYKQMIGACLEENSRFGVVLIRSGDEVGGPPAEPHDIGTAARISGLERLPDGRMNLLAVGEERFRIVRLSRQEPYLVAEVEPLKDVHELVAKLEDPADRVGALFAANYRPPPFI